MAIEVKNANEEGAAERLTCQGCGASSEFRRKDATRDAWILTHVEHQLGGNRGERP